MANSLWSFLVLAVVATSVSAKSTLWESTKDFGNFNVIKNLWNTINVTKDPAGGLFNWDKTIQVGSSLSYRLPDSNDFEIIYYEQ